MYLYLKLAFLKLNMIFYDVLYWIFWAMILFFSGKKGQPPTSKRPGAPMQKNINFSQDLGTLWHRWKSEERGGVGHGHSIRVGGAELTRQWSDTEIGQWQVKAKPMTVGPVRHSAAHPGLRAIRAGGCWGLLPKPQLSWAGAIASQALIKINPSISGPQPYY